jgi:glycosyltransferase involved in cell wall biosynthesis
MKIVHLIAYFHPDLRYQENHLVAEQVKEGHEVIVITSNLNFSFPNYENTMLPVIGPRKKKTCVQKQNGYTTHYLPTYFDISGRVLLKGYLSLVKSINPDLVIAHGVTQLHTLGIIYSNTKSKIIVDEHVLYSDITSSKGRKIFYRTWGLLFSKKLQKTASKIVAISAGVNKLLTSLLKIEADKIQVISLGADSNTYFPSATLGSEFRKKYNIASDAIVIGYTGKIGEYKSVHLLIEAVNKIEYPNLHILIVGNIISSYKPTFEKSVKASRVPVTVLEALPSQYLNSVYNACDIVAWPAHQTISTVDASSCGKPIICSDFLLERYSAGQGIGIKPGNLDSLTQALGSLIHDEDLRREMGYKGREWVINEVSWTAVNRMFVNLKNVTD